MLRYRLYLGHEWHNGCRIPDALFENFMQWVDEKLSAYTTYDAEGVWQREHEQTTILEAVLNDTTDLAYQVAREYKDMFDQEAVLLTKEPVTAELI